MLIRISVQSYCVCFSARALFVCCNVGYECFHSEGPVFRKGALCLEMPLFVCCLLNRPLGNVSIIVSMALAVQV